MENAIILKHVSVIFNELQDKGYGRNIVIDASEPKIQEEITKWVKNNNINGGVAKFKDYTNKEGNTTKQYTFKLSDYTKFDGKDGLSEKDLGYGAIINLQARSYTYENKFGKGTSASLDGVFIVESAKNTVMNNISE